MFTLSFTPTIIRQTAPSIGAKVSKYGGKLVQECEDTGNSRFECAKFPANRKIPKFSLPKMDSLAFNMYVNDVISNVVCD